MTHRFGFLPQCDKIVVMVDGKITETGSYTELIENNGAFAEFLRNYRSEKCIVEMDTRAKQSLERQKSRMQCKPQIAYTFHKQPPEVCSK